MNKEQKQEIVKELHDKFGSAKAAILTDFKGLTVAEVTEFRSELRKANIEYKVVKNTLAKLAASGTSAEKLGSHLNGPTGIVLGYEDPVAPAKAVMEFLKKMELAKKQDKFSVKVGIIEGSLASADQLKAIASLPSRVELLSNMAAGFQAPASKMARLLSATVARMGYALTALKDKKTA
ncbi:MAG TPA: 50S ribosomal protein L10 [Nitrospirota bacterium]